MSSAPLLMLSSMATREILKELAGGHTRSSGQAVDAQAAGGVDVAKRVRAGEAVDVVVLAANVIDDLLAEGHLAGKRVDLVRSGVGIAIPSGRPRPDISSETAVRDAVMAAGSLSFSTGPSGNYLQGLFARWGIADAVRDRIVIPPPGTPVGRFVAEGRADLGFQQLSELINVAGIEVLGPLPAAIQTMTVFSAAVAAKSRDVPAADALIAALASPATGEVKRRFGMEPFT
ncbi:MAG: substrate-binding domain-containing protein [Steroidobacteraceae bacterium]